MRGLVWLLLGLYVLAGPAEAGRGRGSPTTTTPAPPPLPAPVDLTLSFDANSTHWPSEHGFSITKNSSSRSDKGWLSTQSTCASGQTGTHIEAPYHLNERGWKVDELPLTRLIAPGTLLDASGNASRNAYYVLTMEHLSTWEKKHGLPPYNSILLVNFGWGTRLHIPSNESVPPFPGISKEAAEHIVNQGRIVGVGVDLPTVDPGHVRGRPAGRVFLGANIYTLLNLDLTHELPAKGFSVLVLPQKVRGVSAAAARVVATPRSPSKSSAPAGRPASAMWLAGLVVLASSTLQLQH